MTKADVSQLCDITTDKSLQQNLAKAYREGERGVTFYQILADVSFVNDPNAKSDIRH